jgi:hypothetical protein
VTVLAPNPLLQESIDCLDSPYLTSAWSTQKHHIQQFLHCCVHTHWGGNVFSEPLPCNGQCTHVTICYKKSEFILSDCRLLTTEHWAFDEHDETWLLFTWRGFNWGVGIAQSVQWQTTGWMAMFDCCQGQEISLFSTVLRPALGSTQPLIWWALGALSPELKLTTHLYLLLMSGIVEPYLHTPTHLHAMN